MREGWNEDPGYSVSDLMAAQGCAACEGEWLTPVSTATGNLTCGRLGKDYLVQALPVQVSRQVEIRAQLRSHKVTLFSVPLFQGENEAENLYFL